MRYICQLAQFLLAILDIVNPKNSIPILLTPFLIDHLSCRVQLIHDIIYALLVVVRHWSHFISACACPFIPHPSGLLAFRCQVPVACTMVRGVFWTLLGDGCVS